MHPHHAHASTNWSFVQDLFIRSIFRKQAIAVIWAQDEPHI
jgi:hypothetical protein